MAKIKVPSKLPIKEFKCKDVYGREYVLSYTDAPMVEYAPVVRCRDCKRFAEFTSNGKTMGFGSCNNPQNSMSKCPQIDWFCADGVRKDG